MVSRTITVDYLARVEGEAALHATVLNGEVRDKAYEDEVRRQRLMIKKAELNEQRLLFIVTAFKTLLRDENFLTLLRAEHLDTLPKFLAEQIRQRGGG